MTKTVTDTEVTNSQPAEGHSSPGVIVLQWLTYAFWGWTAVALLFLAYIVFSTFMTDRSYGDGPLYAIAATLVLLPLSVVCDMLYVRREPLKKAGASMVVMVIHAVLFAVLGIGALIAAVFTVIQLYVTGGGDTTPIVVWLLSFVVAACIYAVLFVRTLNPFRSLAVAKYIPYGMIALVGLFVILGFAGPLAAEREARDDRRIESHLSGVSSAVEEYVRDNKELPDSLDDVTISSSEAKRLVTDRLVRYINDGTAQGELEGETEHRYQLCVVYVRAHDTGYDDYYTDKDDADGYSEYLSNYSHPKGEVCYKQKVAVFEKVDGVKRTFDPSLMN